MFFYPAVWPFLVIRSWHTNGNFCKLNGLLWIGAAVVCGELKSRFASHSVVVIYIFVTDCVVLCLVSTTKTDPGYYYSMGGRPVHFGAGTATGTAFCSCLVVRIV